MSARRHWLKGAISVDEMSYALRIGIEAFDASVQSVEVTDMREDREKREAEKRKREAQKAPQFSVRTRR
jgi:hypothetical protein